MEFARPLNQGVAESSTINTYHGKHRNLEMLYGIGLIPHGDRNRVKPEYGVDYLEERESLDKYSKYYT